LLPPETEFTELNLRIFAARSDDGQHPVEISVPNAKLLSGACGPAPDGISGFDLNEDSQRLTRWFFADARLASAWAEFRGRFANRSIRLDIDEGAPELHALPWELLEEIDVDGTAWLLSANTRTPFSRYLGGGWEPGAPVRELPLRVLVAIANPDCKGSNYALEPVSEEGEWQLLQEALFEVQGAGLVDIVRLPAPCTLARLERFLRKDSYHILHFLGHGSYDDQDGRAMLFMADAQNKVAPVYETDFAAMISRLLVDRDSSPGLRLIFLASCQTATRSDADAFAGFAPHLVRGNVPAVLAMQGKIQMDTARAFTHTFYRQLLQHGLVDLACNEARATLLTEQYYGAQTPVLFSRLPGNRLVELPQGNRRPVIERQPFEPETVYVTAGTFRMGRTAGPGVRDNESPPADVNLPAYRIGRYPVTNAQYLDFVRETRRPVKDKTGWELANVGKRPRPGTEDWPVVGISWDDAVEYCAWLKKKTDRRYRLPSEAEWEYAARGGDGRLYPWGDRFESSNCNYASTGIGAPTPVGRYSPDGDSPWRCADMAGNVWEWTNTLWGRTPQDPDYAYPYEPGDGRENNAALEPFRELRICRGGSFADSPERVTCTARARNQADSSNRRRGFRVAMEL
jgi:formylglycine-generating enzyme required for sulfatase activity